MRYLTGICCMAAYCLHCLDRIVPYCSSFCQKQHLKETEKVCKSCNQLQLGYSNLTCRDCSNINAAIEQLHSPPCLTCGNIDVFDPKENGLCWNCTHLLRDFQKAENHTISKIRARGKSPSNTQIIEKKIKLSPISCIKCGQIPEVTICEECSQAEYITNQEKALPCETCGSFEPKSALNTICLDCETLLAELQRNTHLKIVKGAYKSEQHGFYPPLGHPWQDYFLN